MLQKKSNGEVTFVFEEESNGPVFLVGDFNNWDQNAHELLKKDGKWSIKLKLKTGQYAYKYFANHSWLNDNAADEYRTNPFGEQDSVVNVFVEKEETKAKPSVTAKKTAAKKTTVKKAAIKKTVAKKTVAKKTVAKKKSSKKKLK